MEINIIIKLCIVVLLCIENEIVYQSISRKKTEKQKAYILSIKNALTLVILSLIYIGELARHSYNIKVYDNEIYNDNMTILKELTVLYFISYLISDIVLGTTYYHKYMCSLSGYPHHIAYIIICLILINSSQHTNLFVLYLLEELPTMILSIGSYDKKYRNDLLFGLTFFITRIMYHAWLTYQARENVIVYRLSIFVFILHMYWFYNWTKKYLNIGNFKSKGSATTHTRSRPIK